MMMVNADDGEKYYNKNKTSVCRIFFVIIITLKVFKNYLTKWKKQQIDAMHLLQQTLTLCFLWFLCKYRV